MIDYDIEIHSHTGNGSPVAMSIITASSIEIAENAAKRLAENLGLSTGYYVRILQQHSIFSLDKTKIG